MTSVLGRLLRDVRTARHIPAAQLRHRARFLLLRRRYAGRPRLPIETARRRARGSCVVSGPPRLREDLLAPEGRDAVAARAARAAEGRFLHLGAEARYPSGVVWVDGERSPLWQYQMQYLGSVLDLALCGQRGAAAELVASWRAAHGDAWHPVAWHPYPVSLRLANLCHSAAVLGSFDALGEGVADLVLCHAAFLLDHLELDVRGNHLLENARALVVAGRHIEGPLAHECAHVGESILAVEIPEQILPDGGHFERAPMYHALVLQRLLEVHAHLGPDHPLSVYVLAPAVRRMAAYLRATSCPDGGILLFGDSARGFAPPAGRLLEVAATVVRGADAIDDTEPGVFLAPDTGVAVLRSERAWVAFDTGPVCPAYLPAHGQSDTLTVEVWLRGQRIVADPGLGEYTGPERAWGRSSPAHSTLTLDDRDHSEAYGSFRVGGREGHVPPAVRGGAVVAGVRPWRSGALLQRSVRIREDDAVRLDDEVRGAGRATVRSRLHLAPGITIAAREERARTLATPRGAVAVRAGAAIAEEPGRCSWEIGRVEATTRLVVDLPSGDPARGWWEIAPAGDA